MFDTGLTKNRFDFQRTHTLQYGKTTRFTLMKTKLKAILKDLPHIILDQQHGDTLQNLQRKYGYAIGTIRKYTNLYHKHNADLKAIRREATRKIAFKPTLADETKKLQTQINTLKERVSLLEISHETNDTHFQTQTHTRQLRRKALRKAKRKPKKSKRKR